MAGREEQDAVPGESWLGTSGADDTESPSAAGVAPAENVDAEWLSEFLAPETAEAFNPAWLELIEGAESAPEADLANLGLTTPGTEDTGHRSVHALEDEEIAAAHELAGAAEQLEGDDAPLQASPLPAGALNLKCGHVGYYGILGRRQKVPDPTAIPYRWVCQLIITRRDSNGKTTMVVGTGVLVSPRHVLTAAHWIKWAGKDDRGLWVTYETTGIRVVPGRYDDGTPLGAAFAKLNMKVASRWNPKAPNLQDDYALIELDTALGDAKPAALRGQKLCYWGSRECPGAVVRAVGGGELDQLQGNGGITAGYFNMRQYASRGGITHVNPGPTMRMAAHPWDGGSPVWINERGEHQLIGLMLASNVVLRLTRPLCDELRAWVGTQVCDAGTAATARKEIATETDPFDPTQHLPVDEHLFARSDPSEPGQERSTIDASDDGEFVTIDPKGAEDDAAARESSGGATVRARILWPALGFPAVIAPGGKSDAEATRCITLLVLSNQRALTPDAVARHLRCVPWAGRARRHIAEGFVAASDVTILAPKVSFTGANESQAKLVEFGGTGATAIRASLATAVTQRYANDLPFLHEIRISESRSAKLNDGLYQLFWNNAATAEDAPSDEMAFLLASYARQKGAALGPLWKTHERYLMDEYEYEYGSLHRPYCSTTAPRVRAEILHPLFVDRGGRPTLKIGHLTDLHVDVRADVYEENVKAKEHQLKAKLAKQALSGDEQALLDTLGLYNNWNRSVVALYNDAKQDANAILLTGDLIDYGRTHWGQDAGAHLQDDDLYTPDRSWFLLSWLLSSGDAYAKPVYTNLGNHDWRINPYPPFAVGAPSSKNFFYKERPYERTVEAEKKLREKEAKHADEALRAAHGDGHKRKFSYAAKAENALELLFESTGDAVKALFSMMKQTSSMNVKDTPAQTTIASIEWYLLSINPFLDYAFTLPNQHRLLMLDWAEQENVLFPIISRGKSFPYMLWQAGAAADPGPKAKSCLTSLQHDLVSGFLKLPGRSKVIGVHAPPIGPYPDWTDRDMLEGRTKYGKERVGKVRGLTDFVTRKPDGTTEQWYGHPLFATRPKSGIEGVTADYGSFESKRDWFIEKVGDGTSNVRVVLSGHIHRNGAYVVHLVGNETGPTLAGERIVYRVKTPDASNVPYPAVSKTPQGKRGPLYVNTTCAGPNGNSHPVHDVDAKRYPGSARVHLAENGTIELVQFRILGAPRGQRAAAPGFAELLLTAG